MTEQMIQGEEMFHWEEQHVQACIKCVKLGAVFLS